MPRPRRLNVDTILGFNCSYALKVGIIRTAEIAGQDSPSSLMRRVMEDHCRSVLGPEQWHELSSAESPDERRTRLSQYLKGKPTRRLRDALGRGAGREVLLAEMSLYAQEYERARDDRQANLALRVAFHEVADLLMKILAILKKSAGGPNPASLLKLTRQLAEPLQKDVDVAVRAFMAGNYLARRAGS